MYVRGLLTQRDNDSDQTAPRAIIPTWNPNRYAQLVRGRRIRIVTKRHSIDYNEVHLPLPRGTCRRTGKRPAAPPAARGLHSFTLELNLSALYGIGGARRGCVARVRGCLRGV